MNDLEQMQESQKVMQDRMKLGAGRRVTFLNNFTEERKQFNDLKTTQAPVKKELDEKYNLDVLENRVMSQKGRDKRVKLKDEKLKFELD